MKYGLLKYIENKRSFNIGDNIQSIAAKQFLPRVDTFINREKIAEYKNKDIKLIMNGWFTHNAHNWIPSDNIRPLFISFHMNNTAAPLMLSEKGIRYLKKHQPIGCRDKYTVKILQEKDIKAYFSGCLTLTLDTYKVDDNERTENIYIVDPLYGYSNFKKITYNYKRFLKSILNGKIFQIGKRNRHLKKFISPNLLKNAIYINQELPARKYSTEEKFEIAEELLHKYAKAKLVITSRIHCALPCLAMGTPVIFVNGFSDFVDSCRFEGVLDLFNRIDIDEKTGNWHANFKLNNMIDENIVIKNLEKHHKLAMAMKKTCNNFVNSEK